LAEEIVPSELVFLRSRDKPEEAVKSNRFIDQFLQTVSSPLPSSSQKDLLSVNWNPLIGEGIQHESNHLPSVYMAHSLYEDEIADTFYVSAQTS